MQLRQTEALCILDEHDGGIGNVDPDLDDDRRVALAQDLRPRDEMARVLKPGAPFYFCVPNANFTDNLSVARFFDKLVPAALDKGFTPATVVNDAPLFFDAGATGKKSADILAYAQSKGLILRGESAKYGSDGWFRVTIGSKEENELFVNTVLEFFGMKK